MSLYKINSISTVGYGKYSDVCMVIATKERNLIASLFCVDKDIIFIISKESPLSKVFQSAKKSGISCEINEDQFEEEKKNGTIYKVEVPIVFYERERAKRMAEAKRKEEERKEAEERERRQEVARRFEEVLNNVTLHELPLSGLQVCVDENVSFSEQMVGIAGNVNLSFITGNFKGVSDNLVLLYNKVHGYNSHLLQTLAAKDGQVVGLAFIKMALYFDNGDFQVNEIAAQNAYYCIVKNYLITKNTSALPALFTLLTKKPMTLADELYNINPDSSLPGFGGLLPSAPYTRNHQAMKNRLPIMKYILSKFYDEGKKSFLIDTTLPYHIPSHDDVKKFYSELVFYNLSELNDIYRTGEEYFKDLYENIEDQLNL